MPDRETVLNNFSENKAVQSLELKETPTKPLEEVKAAFLNSKDGKIDITPSSKQNEIIAALGEPAIHAFAYHNPTKGLEESQLKKSKLDEKRGKIVSATIDSVSNKGDYGFIKNGNNSVFVHISKVGLNQKLEKDKILYYDPENVVLDKAKNKYSLTHGTSLDPKIGIDKELERIDKEIKKHEEEIELDEWIKDNFDDIHQQLILKLDSNATLKISTPTGANGEFSTSSRTYKVISFDEEGDPLVLEEVTFKVKVNSDNDAYGYTSIYVLKKGWEGFKNNPPKIVEIRPDVRKVLVEFSIGERKDNPKISKVFSTNIEEPTIKPGAVIQNLHVETPTRVIDTEVTIYSPGNVTTQPIHSYGKPFGDFDVTQMMEHVLSETLESKGIPRVL